MVGVEWVRELGVTAAERIGYAGSCSYVVRAMQRMLKRECRRRGGPEGGRRR